LLAPAGLSELVLCLWLLIMGVDVPKWHLQNSSSGATSTGVRRDWRSPRSGDRQ